MKNSRIRGFYKLSRGERLDQIRNFANLPVDQARLLGQDGSLNFETADLFIENAIGSFPLPLGIATSFRVNEKDYLIPMAVEESSVIAAASNAARWIYESGGFEAETLSSEMIGQIQILDIAPEHMPLVSQKLEACKNELLQMANEIHPRLVMRGGGARDISVRSFPEAEIPFMVLHLYLDTKRRHGC
jgi:hydroxymethylglutaryl-CoA reductase